MTKYFRTTWVLNALGTGIGESKEEWSFTTEVTLYTFGSIDAERFNDMAYYAAETSERIIDNSGLYNPTFETVGAEVDRPVERSECEGIGMYRAAISVEDRELAYCDFRYRQHIIPMVDDSINTMDREGMLYLEVLKKPSWVSRLLKMSWGIVRGIITRWRGD